MTYEKSDKRRIYWLIDKYLSGDIDEPTFCDEFHCTYVLEIDRNSLTKEECKVFQELGEIAGRFSEFEEDIKKYPGVYYTKEELKQKILETKKKLKL